MSINNAAFCFYAPFKAFKATKLLYMVDFRNE